MKRPKPSVVDQVAISGWKYEYTCPHCRTVNVSYSITEDILRMKCFHCKNPIDLVWEFIEK